MQVNDIWLKIQKTLEERLGKFTYETLIKPTKAIDINENKLIIETPTSFSKEQLSSKYINLIKEVSREITGSELYITFITKDLSDIDNSFYNKENLSNIKKISIESPPLANLNPKYTFENFIVGNNNRFAQAAAIRVAQSPGNSYNPLFIHGGVGLGKTHLMHAIGHYVRKTQPKLKTVYLTSESFTNELIDVIKGGEERSIEFRNKYRNIDLLIIDDIQFIGGKERTQEEFFHTFNALYEAGKQIIISSDRPPQEISRLEERLKSRFEMGLITDIQPPDLETRIAILKKKAELESLQVDDEVLHFIAESFKNNVRELEGAFIRVMAYTSLNNLVPTVELARQIIGKISPPKKISIDMIQNIVSEYYNVDKTSLLGRQRTKDIAWARQIAMYLSRVLTDSSFPQIGETFGGKDHSTVQHAYEKIKNIIQVDINLNNEIQKIIDKIKFY